MEFLLVLAVFGAAFSLLSIGIIFKQKGLKAGSCGSEVVIDGDDLSCGACPSKQAEVCPSGDTDGLATIAQLGNPTRKQPYDGFRISEN